MIRYYNCFSQSKLIMLVLLNMACVLVNVPGWMHCYQSVLCPLLMVRPLSISEVLLVVPGYVFYMEHRNESCIAQSVEKDDHCYFLCLLGYEAHKYVIYLQWTYWILQCFQVRQCHCDQQQWMLCFDHWQQTTISSGINNASGLS